MFHKKGIIHKILWDKILNQFSENKDFMNLWSDSRGMEVHASQGNSN